MIGHDTARPAGVEVVDGPRVSQGKPVDILLTVSPEMHDFLAKLAEDRNESFEETIRIAITILRIAQDAKADGNGLAVVTPDLDVDQEITGY